MMMGQSSAFQPDPANCLDPYKSLSFQLVNDVGEKTIHFPVIVKSLTTAGVILEILHLDNGFKRERLKGREGLFTIITQNDQIMIEVPGKILWTRNREGESGITLGLELLEPLSLPVRHTLEASMFIGAKDMKVLWDYWDEIQESAAPAEIAESEESPTFALENAVTPPKEVDGNVNGAVMYLVGLVAIISGLIMQFLQSEYLGFSGLVVMFLGSLVIGLKSMLSMWRVSSPDPAD